MPVKQQHEPAKQQQEEQQQEPAEHEEQRQQHSLKVDENMHPDRHPTVGHAHRHQQATDQHPQWNCQHRTTPHVHLQLQKGHLPPLLDAPPKPQLAMSLQQHQRALKVVEQEAERCQDQEQQQQQEEDEGGQEGEQQQWERHLGVMSVLCVESDHRSKQQAPKRLRRVVRLLAVAAAGVLAVFALLPGY